MDSVILATDRYSLCLLSVAASGQTELVGVNWPLKGRKIQSGTRGGKVGQRRAPLQKKHWTQTESQSVCASVCKSWIGSQIKLNVLSLTRNFCSLWPTDTHKHTHTGRLLGLLGDISVMTVVWTSQCGGSLNKSRHFRTQEDVISVYSDQDHAQPYLNQQLPVFRCLRTRNLLRLKAVQRDTHVRQIKPSLHRGLCRGSIIYERNLM